MANKTISDLRELSTVSDNNVLVVETNAETFKVTKENLLKEVNEELNTKSNVNHTHDEYVTESELNAKGLATESFVGSEISKIELTPGPKGPKGDKGDKGDPGTTTWEGITNKPTNLATETFVTNKIAEASLSGGNVDLSGYATKEELSNKSDKTHTHSYNDLTDKPTIPSTTNLATKTELTNGLATKADKVHTHDQYLTEHQDLSDYALKNEIPTVPTKTSQLTNDKGYLTSVPSEYVTETELNAKRYLTSHQDISGKANISDLINYQLKEDSTLNTVNKTIVGAINELFNMILGSGGGSTNSVGLSYSFSNETSGYAYGSVALSSDDSANDGTYTICWADASGKLNDYKDISSFTLSGTMVKTYEFILTNAIPKEATRIVAIKDGAIKASYNIPSNKLNTDTKLYSIGLLSDIHIDTTNDQSNSVSDLQNALSRFKTENVTAICCTGDTVVDGTQAEVEKFIEVKNSTTIPMYIARGNHDCRDYSLANWNLVEPNGLYFEKEIGGDIYLFLGMNAEDYSNSIFSTEELTWLETKLEQYKNQRVFLFEHVFIEPTGNINGLYPWSSMGNVEGQSGKIFRNLMAKYRNVILFTGHSHLEFILQRLGDNANCSERTDSLCHRVHIPSCAKPRANDVSTEDVKENTYDKYGSSEGYVMDVYQDYIILKGINFVDNKYLPLAQYRINTTPIIYDDPIVDESNLLFYLDGSNTENTTSLIKDLSGNGNDFVANNIALDTANGAITFDGSSSYLINETLQPVSTANDIFSFEFIAECNVVRTTPQHIVSLGTSSPERISYRFRCVEGDDDIYSDYGATNNLDILSTKSGAVETEFNNKKHHVVIVRKDGELLTYLDGVLNRAVTKDSDTTTIEPRTVIGSKYSHDGGFFGGNLYMLKLYNGALTADEVLNKYNMTK